MNENTIPLIDTHCHLTWGSFASDLDQVVLRMGSAGVSDAVVVATSLENSRQVRELCLPRACLHPAAGAHPNDLPDDLDQELRGIEELLSSGEFVAVGESGLDYFRDRVPREAQQRSFHRHAELALERDLPLIVHIRDRDGRDDAFSDVGDVLAAHPGVRGVIHCYTGSRAHAERYLELGFLISFSGVLTFPKGENVRQVAAVVPLDRILVETDAPFLAPQPWRGKRNEPAYVAETARKLAEVRGLEETEIRRVTTENARRLFPLEI
ncbi:MAG: TatD family hydrolase [Planctomycetota bacterium]